MQLKFRYKTNYDRLSALFQKRQCLFYYNINFCVTLYVQYINLQRANKLKPITLSTHFSSSKKFSYTYEKCKIKFYPLLKFLSPSLPPFLMELSLKKYI